MKHNFWLAKPYGLANQKLCYIQIYKVLEKKTKNFLEYGWWIQTLIGRYIAAKFCTDWSIFANVGV